MGFMSRSIVAVCAAASVYALLATDSAQAEPFVRLDEYSHRELQVVGFQLPRAAKVEVEAVGVDRDDVHWSYDHDDDDRDNDKDRDNHRGSSWRWGESENGGPLATAWLVETATRKVVWTQTDGRRDRNHSDGDRDQDGWTSRVKDTIDLAPGRYELYAWAGANWGDNGGIEIHSLHDLKSFVRSKSNYSSSRMRRAFRDCSVQLSADGLRESDTPRFTPNGEIPGTVYRAVGLGDEAFVRSAFRVDRKMSIRVYALVEMPRDWRQCADGGYIVNAATRERVWDVRDRELDEAGGAHKNRVFDRDIELEPGRYELCYGTDGTHSNEEWNAAPPYDPLNWGITILPGKGFDAAAFHIQGEFNPGDPVVDLTRARDNDSLEKGFRLARETNVRVYAHGEWSDGADEFADGGWITNARTGEVVWEMTKRNTETAGGAEKNRLFDGIVRLPAGDYIAHYETDDSHAFRDWNADAPWDRNAWGLALYPGAGASDADFQVSDVSSADVSSAASGDLLVSLVRVRDDEHRKRKFELATEAKVRIRALGEGDDGELYDYAWIEDDRGRVVWEMTWRNTRHAGGASKNRMFDDVVLLDKGSYEVHYVTDGSHSYRSWNARKPRDPDAWGVSISRVDR